MSPLDVLGLGFAAPGLVGWPAARGCLAGAAPYQPEPLPRLNPAGLPANERRRLSTTMRLALTVAGEAMADTGVDPQSTLTVFASANGDGDIIHSICEELARPEPAVSPTQFHNSVHNAPAGYFSIAAHAMTPYTAVSAHDGTFAAGLLEAAALAHEGAPVLLVVYDRPLPMPLGETRPSHDAFACALLLQAGAAADVSLELSLENGGIESTLVDPELETLRAGNPAARALPLFERLAQGAPGRVRLPYIDDTRLMVTCK
ncbi:MAG: beta-ketoacyl synthase chain length factor [Gammaproteobacteria bacterium]